MMLSSSTTSSIVPPPPPVVAFYGSMDKTKQEVPRPSLTIDEALEQLPFSGYHFLLVLMCGFAFMADAMEVSLLSFLPACAGEEWGLDR